MMMVQTQKKANTADVPTTYGEFTLIYDFLPSSKPTKLFEIASTLKREMEGYLNLQSQDHSNMDPE